MWEREIEARWSSRGEEGREERARLSTLWDAAAPLSEEAEAVLEQILGLSSCNWQLEAHIMGLCEAIGRLEPDPEVMGHRRSITDERWLRVAAYYLALRSWLPLAWRSAYPAMLAAVDPDGETAAHVRELLGERTPLKELYVERFCLAMEWCCVGGLYPVGSAQGIAHTGAVQAIERAIRQRDPDGDLLEHLEDDGMGALEPCHHKAFRRYDIVISSIGEGRWRGGMPARGSDGYERAALHERYLVPLENWLEGRGPGETEFAGEIHHRLGRRDDERRFLAALLASLLRLQQRQSHEIARRNELAGRGQQGA
jgi:hypothetical protein